MPLTGKRIVNTRATHQNSRFTALLQAQGAEVIEYPCIAIAPPENDAPLRAALADLTRYDWLVLTSANTVLALAAVGFPSLRFPSLPPAPSPPDNGREGENSPPQPSPIIGRGWRSEGRAEPGEGKPNLAAVGPATAKAAQTYLGLETVLLPETFTAEALGEALPIKPGQRVLIPASAIAPPTLAEQLTARGAEVTVVEAYRTVRGTGGADVAALLAQKRVDAVTFTSASTVENFLVRLESEGGSRAELVGVCLACIGPQTAAAAQAHGLTVDVMPTTHTLDGLVEALQNYYG
ncbi:uroporphyrinogen-III synthase [Armatimonas sp.]|uniref:uroporphyrinogen-III synthase n=1 Tax=Armatimonas sp. TaxID=1872638 RepID=UPI00286A7D93|nr:uroporphyrinogen-III synthase [Armatimonas sp.]